MVSSEIGEIVAVRYDNDNWWYRARVVGNCIAGKIKVSAVCIMSFCRNLQKKSCYSAYNFPGSRCCLKHNCSTYQVFYVDYGHYGLVCREEVRNIKPEFLVVPYQAVECYLPGLCFPDSATDSDKAEAK